MFHQNQMALSWGVGKNGDKGGESTQSHSGVTRPDAPGLRIRQIIGTQGRTRTGTPEGGGF